MGTEVQWLASLVGAQGPKGDTGAAGAKGDKGDTGSAGSQGEKGDQGDKGDTGDVGPAGEAGAAGEIGPAGPGVPVAGALHYILSKASTSDYDTAWADVNDLVDWDRIASMISTAIANSGGGGTDPGDGGTDPGDGGDNGGDTGDLLVTRWTANGLSSPITPNGALSTAMSIDTNGDGTAPTANGSTLILNRGSYLAGKPLVFSLATTADDTTTQTPSVFRVGIKGILAVDTGSVVDTSEWQIGQFTFSTHWSGSALRVTYGRNGNGELIDSDDGTVDLGNSHFYEAEWTNDASAAGGTMRFYVDGVQLGSDKPTSMKLRLSDNMETDVNASGGNAGGGQDNMSVEYLEISYKA
ncbi:hypothetical protein [Sphingomonas oryzagri]